MIAEPTPSPTELFNATLESFRRGDVEEAVACARAAFFENLYVAPTLIGEEVYPQEIWYPCADAEPRAAADYVSRFGRLWSEADDALLFLREIWNDPLVRAELQSFLGLSKSLFASPSEEARMEGLREAEWFRDARRIRRSQSEIVARLRRNRFQRPLSRPSLASIVIASRDPSATVAFFRELLRAEPLRSSGRARGFAELELPGSEAGPGLRLVIHGQHEVAAGDPYALGPPPASLGWGAVLVFRVAELDRYHEHAVRARLNLVDRNLDGPRGERYFVVREPSGYLVEISE